MAERAFDRGGNGTLSAWLAALFVLACALHFLAGQGADPDLWQHVRFGELICGEGSFPRTDTFSYTAFGAPILNHEWLAQCAFARLFATGGSAALIWLKLAVGAVLVLALIDCARTLQGELLPDEPLHPWTVAGVLSVALAVVSPGMMFRPQLFTIALLAIQAALLARADRRLRHPGPAQRRISWELAGQPLLVGLWANLHGGFLVGLFQLLLYLAVAIACGSLPKFARSAPRLSRRETACLLAIALAGVLAPLANPYGPGLYAFLLRTLRMHDAISEWFPIPLWSRDFGRFKLLVAASAIALGVLWRMRRERPAAVAIALFETPLLLLMAGYAFRHQRHSVLFAVLAAPLAMVAVDHLRRVLVRRWPVLIPRPPVARALLGGAALIAALQLYDYARDVRESGMAIRFGRLDFPADAVEFLRAHGLSGNVAAPFEWGSYVIWKLSPDSRVFIDGRFETVYPQRVIDDYFAFMRGDEGWQRLLDVYPTDIVIVQRWRDIHPRLFERPDLEYVYSDPAALVFVRRSARTQAALDRLRQVANRADFAPPETVFP